MLITDNENICDVCKWFHCGCDEEEEHSECSFFDKKGK